MIIIKILGIYKNQSKKTKKGVDKELKKNGIVYAKICCICNKLIENEFYEEIKGRREHCPRYFHVKCYNRLKLKNQKGVE